MGETNYRGMPLLRLFFAPKTASLPDQFSETSGASLSPPSSSFIVVRPFLFRLFLLFRLFRLPFPSSDPRLRLNVNLRRRVVVRRRRFDRLYRNRSC